MNLSPNIWSICSTIGPILPLLQTTTDCVLSWSKNSGRILKVKISLRKLPPIIKIPPLKDLLLCSNLNVFWGHICNTSGELSVVQCVCSSQIGLVSFSDQSRHSFLLFCPGVDKSSFSRICQSFIPLCQALFK